VGAYPSPTTIEGNAVTDESDWRVPSPWMRFLGIMGAVFIAVYGTIGVLRDDLNVSLSKSGAGVHLHGRLAWLCFAGMMMMSIGLTRFLGPASGDGKFDFDRRRRRFGPMVAVGLTLYVASQAIADLRS
jgi:hypothetical protein